MKTYWLHRAEHYEEHLIPITMALNCGLVEALRIWEMDGNRHLDAHWHDFPLDVEVDITSGLLLS